jgi:uncharacterized protein YcbX
MQSICQRCGESQSSWRVRQAEFHVGELHFWKVQLCERCAIQIADPNQRIESLAVVQWPVRGS